jgi:hypothetical protein
MLPEQTEFRCAQSEPELARLRQLQEQLEGELGAERQITAESAKRTQELEQRLSQGEVARQSELVDMAHRIRLCMASLTRVAADLDWVARHCAAKAGRPNPDAEHPGSDRPAAD